MVNCRKKRTRDGQRAAVQEVQFCTWAGDSGPIGQRSFILHLRNLQNSGIFHSGSISQLVRSFLSKLCVLAQVAYSEKCF